MTATFRLHRGRLIREVRGLDRAQHEFLLSRTTGVRWGSDGYHDSWIGTLTEDIVGYKRLQQTVYSTRPAVDGRAEFTACALVPVVAVVGVPEGSLVRWGTKSRKCRASRALLLAHDGDLDGFFLASTWDTTFRYDFGEWIHPVGGFAQTFAECARGIHFYPCLPDAELPIG